MSKVEKLKELNLRALLRELRTDIAMAVDDPFPLVYGLVDKNIITEQQLKVRTVQQFRDVSCRSNLCILCVHMGIYWSAVVLDLPGMAEIQHCSLMAVKWTLLVSGCGWVM